MKVVLFPILVIVLFIASCAKTEIPAQPPSSDMAITSAVPITYKNMTLEGVANTAEFAIPIPDYLPDDWDIQEIYIESSHVRLIISDKNLDKLLVTRTANNRTFQEYEFQCMMDIGITYGDIVGGLKLPGERPPINPTVGLTAASVIMEHGNTHTLWWDWRPSNVAPVMYEITFTASNLISKNELVKVAESMTFLPR